MSFPKSLIIGLGGIGSDIVSKVYKRFTDSQPTEIDKEMVGFLCFDTDNNDISERRKIMPREYVVQTSAAENITVATYLDKIRDKCTVEEWFDTSQKLLNEMTLNDGAGQIRMASRLALSMAINENKFDIIQSVINRLLEVKADKEVGNDIRVHIVSTMAGGTGAGSFMQIAYFVKEILRNQKGLDKPRITGYFLLADVLCQDPSTQFDEQKANNTLANSYASLKELNGIYNYDKSAKGFNIDFEYRFFSKEEQGLSLPDYEPFEISYLYDYEDSRGGNRGKKENYYDQIEDYLYLNVLSPVGAKTRSASINDILGNIRTGGAHRYAATGVSKIVYPVDDLLRYFSLNRISENLKVSWLRIDREYNLLLKEYKRQLNLGVIAEKPEKAKFFMDQVEYLSKNGNGLEKMIFRRIYQSTQIFDKNGNQTGIKSREFIKELLAYLEQAKENKKSISEISGKLLAPADFRQNNDAEQDLGVIQANDTVIAALHKEVGSFIENTKSLGIEEGLLADFQVSNLLSHSRSRVNSYLLKNEEVLHPIAVRYFLYDLRKQIGIKLATFNEENVKIRDTIESYSQYFDIKDDQEKDDHIESASDAYIVYSNANKNLIRKLGKIFGRSGSLDEFKDKYISRTKRQVNLLNEYAVTKLQEEVLSGLLNQIDLFIEEIERLFEQLADVHASLLRESEGLLKMHENQSNKSTQYVLASAELKQKIYSEKISDLEDIEFPQDLSRLIYEGLYKIVYQKVNKNRQANVVGRTISEMFAVDVVNKQTESLKDKFKEDLAGFNVIKAIRYEADLKGIDSFDLLKSYFRNATALANPLGAKNVTRSPHINSWALHPESLDIAVISESDADEIMGSPGDQSSGAYRLASKFFSKFEVIREDSRFLLSVPENYPQFSSGNKGSVYSVTPVGKYFKAYTHRIEEVLNGVSVSPHLDKRWHFPGYFPNLGETREVVAGKIYRSFFWSLVNKDIIPKEENGDKFWVFIRSGSNTTRTIQDQRQKSIKLSLSDLVFNGLYANPGIVDSVIERAYRILEENKYEFENNLNLNKTEALINLPLIQGITGFRINEIRQLRDLSILQILEKISLKDKDKMINVIIETIIESILFIGGNNSISQKSARRIFNMMLGVTGKEKYSGSLKTIIDNMMKSKFDGVS